MNMRKPFSVLMASIALISGAAFAAGEGRGGGAMPATPATPAMPAAAEAPKATPATRAIPADPIKAKSSAHHAKHKVKHHSKRKHPADMQ